MASHHSTDYMIRERAAKNDAGEFYKVPLPNQPQKRCTCRSSTTNATISITRSGESCSHPNDALLSHRQEQFDSAPLHERQPRGR